MSRSTLIALVALSAGLVACGSAAEEEQVPSTVAPLPPAAAPAAPSSSSAPARTTTTTPAPQDRTREISEIPTVAPGRPAEEQAYLDDLPGIRVEGVEDQLVGIAQDVCLAKSNGTTSYLVEGFAGQLQEQGYLDVDPAAAAATITDAATRAFCP
ncbi:DUF732 domain-containing protein [Corynebacterium sp. 13CS0277]|uniref:DUF732 domain-containing protein n=1 Tax=Corynebacterium sp. 13CS0277 TaxID=2071994 RepID=UPI001304A8A4|nr:DUF732 domain-containing protein [Corynebacterium sp. 13CS0277]